MTKVVGVRFRNVGKIYYFSPKDYEIKTGDHVIVETARGIEYGKVVLAPREVGEEDVVHPLKEVLRVATKEDDEREAQNRVAKCLERLKVDVIEAGFAISSPGDFESVKTIAETVRDCSVASLARATQKDIDCAWEAVKNAADPRIHVFLATSPLHMEYKLKMTPEQVLARTAEMVKYAKQYTSNIEFSCEDATRSDTDFLIQVVNAAVKNGATVINLPDTVGYTTPDEMRKLIEDVMAGVENSDKVEFSVHCHNDLGMAGANSLAGVLGHTALVLKEPKTKTSIRRVYLPKTVAYMLVERKKEIDELMDLFGDEYIDNNLVFCSSNGRPMESQVINRAFNKLIKENGLPHVVFHSLRHSSITYKLKLNGGDMKSVQGDSGHAQVKMVADVYSHIIDEDRCINAQRLEEAFYSSKTPDPVEDTEPKTADTAVTESDESDAAKILELLKNPETAALLKQLAKAL